MLKIGLIGAFTDRGVLRSIRDSLLLPAGYTVAARWIDRDRADGNLTVKEAWEVMEEVFEDIRACDLIIYKGSTKYSIGRHVDFGYALALNKPIIRITFLEPSVYQRHRNVFYCGELEKLPQEIEQCHTRWSATRFI